MIFWDFELQTDHLIQARRPDIILIFKKKNLCSGYCHSSRPQSENKRKQNHS